MNNNRDNVLRHFGAEPSHALDKDVSAEDYYALAIGTEPYVLLRMYTITSVSSAIYVRSSWQFTVNFLSIQVRLETFFL